MAPMRSPPLGSFSILSSGRRLMSTSPSEVLDVELHQVDQRGAAGDELALPLAASQGLVDTCGLDVVKGLHGAPPWPSGPRPAHLAHGGNNIGVGAAAADVAGHGVLDVVVAGPMGSFSSATALMICPLVQ